MPHNFRHVWPSELDLMAQLAGLEFEARFANWERHPFIAESTSHVSVWRRPPTTRSDVGAERRILSEVAGLRVFLSSGYMRGMRVALMYGHAQSVGRGPSEC